MATKSISSAAKVLSQTGAAKGGRARASVLSPQQRSESARNAVNARWAKAGKVPPTPAPSKQTEKSPEKVGDGLPFAAYPGSLRIGKKRMRCYVLDDGRRVLTQSEVLRLLTGSPRPTSLNRYLAHLPRADKLATPILFHVRGLPQTVRGYEGKWVIDMCDAYLDAWTKGKLHEDQIALAIQAETVIRACAKVGIDALIDEATGYQKVRHERALQIKLQAYIADDLQDWARMFPEEFWQELARLESVHYSASQRPWRWGKYVMMFVYDAMDRDVGDSLRDKNPKPAHGHNHHQLLRPWGQDQLRIQIGQAVGVMKTCEDMREFKQKFARIFDRPPLQLSIDDLL